MPSIWRKTSGSWSKIKTVYRKNNGSWVTIKHIWRKSGGTWRLVYLSALTPSIETRVSVTASIPTSPNYTVTLTGTLYHWNDSTSVSYQFIKSTNATNWTAIASYATSTNPATGSPNTNDTYLVNQANVVANTTNYYQYVSRAQNSTYSTEQTSTSDYVVIEACRDITNLSSSAVTGSSNVNLSWTASVYAGRQQIQYRTSGGTWTTFGGVTGSATSATVTGLSYSTAYDFKITPWTGSTGTTSGTYTGYYGNDSNIATTTTNAATVSPPTIISMAGPTVSRNSTSTYTYSTTNGSWNGSPTGYTYQWYYYRSLAAPPYYQYITISGATSSSYTSSSTYVGYDIYCIVTATNSGGSGTATSNFVTITSTLSVPASGTVSISTNTGTYAVGSIITYSTAGWTNSPTSYYLELHNGTNPVLTSDPLRASTTSSSGTYTITSSDVPNYFKAWATASNAAGTSSQASSSQVGPASNAVSVPATPTGLTISGSGLMSWNASTGATSYTVTYWLASSASGANAFNAGTVNVGNVTSYQISYANNPSTGVYCNYADGIVLASNSAGSSNYSAWYPSSTTYV